MLHTVLLILKILGILLAAILGILLLLGGIVLFVPARYEGAVRSEGDIRALRGKMKITWLMHFVRADICYKDGKMKWRVRVAWIKRTSGQVKEERIHEKEQKEEHEEDREAAAEIVEGKKEIPEEGQESRESCKEGVEALEKAESTGHETAALAEGPQGDGKEREGDTGESKGVGGKLARLFEKIKAFFKKIKCTIQSVCDKIRLLLHKKDKLMEFVRDEVHVRAFKRTKREVFALIRRLKPKELSINVRYGFEDPCMTGQALAGLSMLYPFIGEHVDITPDFEERVLEGSILAKGKVYVYHFLILFWNLFWCRDVRTSYRHIRTFEF